MREGPSSARASFPPTRIGAARPKRHFCERRNLCMDEQLTPAKYTPASALMYEAAKRVFDVVVCLALLTLFLLPFLAIAAAILCTSRGAVFYKQVRVGRSNRMFLVWKFRTMYSDADRCGPLITSSDDCRITPIGKYLRNLKMDELPQLWNVVRGDMSLVGPRPQVPRFVDQFPSEQRDIIMTVRPGITGPTQLQFRDEEKMLKGQPNREDYYIERLLPIKCQMDVDYVHQRSFGLDFSVLWETGKIITLSLIRRALGRNQAPAEAVVSASYPSYARHESFRDDVDEAVARSGS